MVEPFLLSMIWACLQLSLRSIVLGLTEKVVKCYDLFMFVCVSFYVYPHTLFPINVDAATT